MFDTVACASYRRLDASIGASERHDLAVRVSIIRPARYCSPDAAASTASRSAFVTCARPSVGRDGEGYRSDLGPFASEISEFQKLVARPSRRLRMRPGRVLINPERSQTWRCPRYPRKRTSGLAFGPSALCRFCCRSPLKASANNDSLTLTRSAAGMGHDGSVGAGSRAAVLFVLP